MTKHVEHFFTYILAICSSPFASKFCVFIKLFLLIIKYYVQVLGSLYILDINSCYMKSQQRFFSHYAGRDFSLVIVALCCAEIFSSV